MSYQAEASGTHKRCTAPKFVRLCGGSMVAGEGKRYFSCTGCGLHITVEPVPSYNHAEEEAHVADYLLS